MSSPPEGKLETKAGHPPAVKAGGMRIVQKHPHSGDTKEEKDKDDQEWESPSPPKPTVFISGVIARKMLANHWTESQVFVAPFTFQEPLLLVRPNFFFFLKIYLFRERASTSGRGRERERESQADSV
ncbi:death-associated protein 1 isoform X1 [Halichoerus grypus]|uniref:death-associated protein 1 isoform X1 n=1 Tax=Halichoerus grypus TaxID=9711 RepID=UPI0016595472|nr:death-associated protein 1 isoform X1 [Halichoerus grypus]